MAIKHQVDQRINTLHLSASSNAHRLSDARVNLYGGRGGRTDEVNWLNSVSGGSDSRLSDSWVTYGNGWLGSPTDTGNRLEQARRASFETGSLV